MRPLFRRLVLAVVLVAAPVRGHTEGDPAADHLRRTKLISATTLGGMYAALAVWSYFAWYYDKPTMPFKFGGDGLFGDHTYAGGADKLGHMWSNHMISRLTGEILIAGGWRPLPASLMSSGLCLAFFTLVEVKDGYYYEFSPGDLSGDALGAALSVLMLNVPAIDRGFDFRIDYWPTPEYRHSVKDGNVDFAEDYSGQTYYLAYHLGSLDPLADSPSTSWTRYVDLVAGFGSRNYKPEPTDPLAIQSQHLFLGVALDLQGVLARLYGEPGDRDARLSHRIGHTLFEYVSPPYTTLNAVDLDHTRSGN